MLASFIMKLTLLDHAKRLRALQDSKNPPPPFWRMEMSPPRDILLDDNLVTTCEQNNVHLTCKLQRTFMLSFCVLINYYEPHNSREFSINNFNDNNTPFIIVLYIKNRPQSIITKLLSTLNASKNSV